MMWEPFPTGAIERVGGGRAACVAGWEWGTPAAGNPGLITRLMFGSLPWHSRARQRSVP